MNNISLVCFILGLSICPSLSIKCYREVQGGDPDYCITTSGAVDEFLETGKGVVDTIAHLFGNKKGGIVNSWGVDIKIKTGIDLSKAGTEALTRHILNYAGADFDLSNNCYVRYVRSTNKTTERACGALGAGGEHAVKLVGWFQGKEYGGNCIKVPGNGKEEVCFCNKDNCNYNACSAKKAMGIDPDAKVIECENMEGKPEECPLKDMRNHSIEFNNACYIVYNLKDNEKPVSKGCFTKLDLDEYAEIFNLGNLTSASRKISDGTKTLEISNIQGQPGWSSNSTFCPGSIGVQLHVKPVFMVPIVIVAYFI